MSGLGVYEPHHAQAGGFDVASALRDDRHGHMGRVKGSCYPIAVGPVDGVVCFALGFPESKSCDLNLQGGQLWAVFRAR